MVKLVKLKYSDKYFYVKLKIFDILGVPVGIWVGIDDKTVYNSDEIVFSDD